MKTRLMPVLFLVALSLGAPACGSDDHENATSHGCEADESWNELTGICEYRPRTGLDAGDESGDSNSGGNNQTDAGFDSANIDTADNNGANNAPNSDAGTSDSEENADCRDLDGDGFADAACGGTDCDDREPSIFPSAAEVCDEVDNDCDGQLNQGLTCSFYAQSPQKLYQVDPFKKTATPITDVPGLTDMDTHPDGTLYGITFSELYRFDAASTTWQYIGDLGLSGTPNGLAINISGMAFLTGDNTVYNLNLATGETTVLGSMGSNFSSSGDCVVTKGNTLYMSSRSTQFFGGTDVLVRIDRQGVGSAIGTEIGFSAIYGLTAAWGTMYGLTGSGQLIEINPSSGVGTLVHQFPGITWHGAASTPRR